MHAESTALLQNMSAPPRSVVKLPRLAVRGAAGPSNARCVAVVDLPTAVCVQLDRPCNWAPLLAQLGLARAVLALLRQDESQPTAGDVPGNAALHAELAVLATHSDAQVVNELGQRLVAPSWPTEVPGIAIAEACSNHLPKGRDEHLTPERPDGIVDAVLAVRLASRIRGPLFLRDAAPSLSHLLELGQGPQPTGSWRLWQAWRPAT
jgi:hypothetical protein